MFHQATVSQNVQDFQNILPSNNFSKCLTHKQFVKMSRPATVSQVSRSKKHFRSHSSTLQVFFEVRGHMGQGQRSRGSRSKVKKWFQVSFDRLTGYVQGHGSGSKVMWVKVKGQVVKPSLKVMILAVGLMSTPSCFVFSIKGPMKIWYVWRRTPASSVKLSNELQKVFVEPAATFLLFEKWLDFAYD